MSTIKDIAKKAGVSPTTVANVLHGKTNKVSPATSKKVQAIIDSENYAPNMGAMILVRNNSRIIGVIMFMKPRQGESVLEDPFSSAILGAMEQEIRMNGYYMMLCITSDENEVVRLSKAWKMEGLILVWVPGTICRIINQSIDTPLVYIDCYFTDEDHLYHNIGLQDREGGQEIARYLVAMGHRSLMFLANNVNVLGGDPQRFFGCQEVFLEHGLQLEDSSFCPLPDNRKDRSRFYRTLVEQNFPYTALVFSSDYLAAEALTYFKEHGIEVPDQISITGFDDNMYSRLVTPRITTIHQDSREKGRLAICMLMKLLHNEEVENPNILLPVKLVIRESVKDLRS
jgi:LacI family transcriptional regulator